MRVLVVSDAHGRKRSLKPALLQSDIQNRFFFRRYYQSSMHLRAIRYKWNKKKKKSVLFCYSHTVRCLIEISKRARVGSFGRTIFVGVRIIREQFPVDATPEVSKIFSAFFRACVSAQKMACGYEHANGIGRNPILYRC